MSETTSKFEIRIHKPIIKINIDKGIATYINTIDVIVPATIKIKDIELRDLMRDTIQLRYREDFNKDTLLKEINESIKELKEELSKYWIEVFKLVEELEKQYEVETVLIK